MNCNGFALWHRRVLKHPYLGKNPQARHILSDLVLLAAWDDTVQDWNGAPVDVRRGQVMISTRELAKMTGYGRQIVRTTLENMLKHSILEVNPLPNQGPMIITLRNYNKFQGSQPTLNPPPNPHLTHTQPTKETIEQINNTTVPENGTGPGLFGTRTEHKEVDQPSPAPKPKAKKKTATRIQYPEQFEEVWKAFPEFGRQEKKNAYAEWQKLSVEDKIALPGMIAMLHKKIERERRPGFDANPPYMHRWLRNKLDDYREVASAVPQSGPERLAWLKRQDEDTWVEEIRKHANGTWPIPKLGPPPCRTDCIAPMSAVRRAGIEPAAYDEMGGPIDA